MCVCARVLSVCLPAFPSVYLSVGNPLLLSSGFTFPHPLLLLVSRTLSPQIALLIQNLSRPE